MNNLALLKDCISNPEKFLDDNYMFVEKNKDLTKYVEDVKEIKLLLIAIKVMTQKEYDEKILRKLYIDLQKFIRGHKRINCSEFGCFVNACDSRKEEIEEDLGLLIDITNLYLEKRDLNEIVPSEWIQAILDKSSSRKKGHSGVGKLINILEDKKYIK